MDSATVSASDLNTLSLYREVVAMRKNLDNLYHKLVKIIPASEGSDEWWDKENKLAMDDYKAGRYTHYNSVDDFVKSLKTS